MFSTEEFNMAIHKNKDFTLDLESNNTKYIF